MNLQEKGITLYYEMMKHKKETRGAGFYPFYYNIDLMGFNIVHQPLMTSCVEVQVLTYDQYLKHSSKIADESRIILPHLSSEQPVILFKCDPEFITNPNLSDAREWLFRTAIYEAISHVIKFPLGFEDSMRATYNRLGEANCLAFYKIIHNSTALERFIIPRNHMRRVIELMGKQIANQFGSDGLRMYGRYEILHHVVSYDMMPLAVEYLRAKLIGRDDDDSLLFEKEFEGIELEKIHELYSIAARQNVSDTFTLKQFLDSILIHVTEKVREKKLEAEKAQAEKQLEADQSEAE